jgi:cytochrome c-type biogenesis protein CcsB
MLRVLKLLASPMLMAVLIIAFCVACAIATFIENDFGVNASRVLVYEAWWFELIMFLLALNFLSSVFTRKLYKKEKLSVCLFHIGFVVILIGAAITRYFGHEGQMHIRQGETVSSFSSSDTWITIMAGDEVMVNRKVNYTPVSRNKFSKTLKIDNQNFKIELSGFIPHAIKTVVEQFDGSPVVSLVVIDSLGNQPILIDSEKSLKIGTNSVGFTGKEGLDFEFNYTDSGMVCRSLHAVSIRSMIMEGQITVNERNWFKLEKQNIYITDKLQFAYGASWPKAKIKMVYSPDPSIQGSDVLVFNVSNGLQSKEVFVPFSYVDDNPVIQVVDNVSLGFKYSHQSKELPFGIKLKEFVLERYPGSQSPSSFISNVQIIDNELISPMPFSIYMNNILNYRGYRFYQSSYDHDEKGTYLSVNKDSWGTSVTYFGYFILIFGILWSLLAPGTRFRKLITKPSSIILLLISMMGSSMAFSQAIPVTDRNHAAKFGQIQLQDKGGRMKPLSTLASEVLRKLNRSNSFRGQSPEQVFLSMSAFPEFWQHVPIIKIKSGELKTLLGIISEHAAFTDFFDHQAGGSYKLRFIVQEAIALKPSQRTGLQKDAIKADEKVNILYMIFTGQMASIFPVPNHPDDKWITMAQAVENSDSIELQRIAKKFADYLIESRKAAQTGNWDDANSMLDNLLEYQQLYGSHILLSGRKLRAETLANRFLVFERLIPFYGISGLILLVLVFVDLFRKTKWNSRLYMVFGVILIIGFVLHSFGIGLRWYIAGRAPLSNAYETMIYIAWAALLAGFIFAKRSRVVLPATALLSTLTLFVAHLSWMDPEITNLVPVLKSYWLTIHVAVITASYGFFGLSAILGLFNLVLFSLKTKKNKTLIDNQVDNITNINELNLTLGLYLITIGSFLGAVWANESWGRYWGWDPKETWALITILVYAFILHMRLIPSFKTPFGFNFASLIALGSVLMTYFGVNYYLSGLHSYAGGDPMPIPSWIFFVVAAIFSLGFFAWYNNRLVDAETYKE